MTREIQGLRHVKLLRSRPDCIPQGRPRGAKATGVRYEEALTKQTGFLAASHGVWFEFDDTRGHGYAQVDFVFYADSDVIVAAEAKLTWTPQAYPQLRRLYFPLLAKFTSRPVGGIIVCQNLTRDVPRSDVCDSLVEALRVARNEPGRIPVLHLPLLLKEPRRVTRPKPRVPSWWRKGQTSPRVGHPGE